jgi:hypothetical protein
VFEQLSVLANGWTLEAAEAVCAGNGVSAEDVLDAVLQLLRKSLVVRIDTLHGTTGYGLLESLRQYAWSKLEQRGAELAHARQRHASYYSALVARLDPAASTKLLAASGETDGRVFEILDNAQDNVQLALKSWLETRRTTEGLNLIRGLGPLWQWNGFPVDGRRWVEAMLELAASATDSPSVSAAEHAQALTFASTIAQLNGGDSARARTFGEASVALWRRLDDPVGLAMALALLSGAHLAGATSMRLTPLPAKRLHWQEQVPSRLRCALRSSALARYS